MIEPSNAERADWPDATRAYVEALEQMTMDLATAITALDNAADGNYWHVSKGKSRPDEPMFAAAIYPSRVTDDEPLAISEGDDLAAVIHDCALQMGDAAALRKEHGDHRDQ